MSASLDRPSEATETSTSSPVSRSNSNISVLPSYESPSANRPPRPPTRRTSSRLKSVMLSALQTNLDRLHPQEAPVSSLWRSLSSLNTSVSSLTDTDQYVQRISASASSSPVSAGSRQTLRSDFIDLKNGIMSSTADTTSGVKTQHSPVLAPPPRKPQRQGTPENMEKKTLGLPSSLATTTAKSSENNGDSLRDLIRLRRMSTTRQARPDNGTCLES
ncbi:expressed unknown protein [Seminavis robusta]|uniref:Uncharacterized protein n=1 Tax=Seminavis robusta TaxID=568900 RepID=A0A9N8HTB0_9STRA|nr:expressed unknown protein [Seminavis robusta]|eukprot:Sro1554_g282050.1 n/a (217) ;mRNA; f:19780-20430